MIDWKNGCTEIIIDKDENKPYILNEDITMSKNVILDIAKDFEILSNHSSVEAISQSDFEISRNLEINKNTYIAKNQNFLIKNNVKKFKETLFCDWRRKFQCCCSKRVIIHQQVQV